MALLLLGRPAEHAVVTLLGASLALTTRDLNEIQKLVAEVEELTCGTRKSAWVRAVRGRGGALESVGSAPGRRQKNQTHVIILAVKSSHVLLPYPRQSPRCMANVDASTAENKRVHDGTAYDGAANLQGNMKWLS